MTQTARSASTPGPPPASSVANGDMSGQTLGEFQLLRRLGQGGMGQVYLAEQLSLKRKVAIKIMRPDLAITPVAFQRFRAEAEAIARLNHANIVQVFAFGEQAGLHFMALEYVEGRNLREYLAKKGTVDPALAIRLMRQVASALERAEELGIIHRDIKPENILLTRRGEIKVADFGLSRCFATDQPAVNLTQSGITLGTPLYMSPEQVQGLPLDPRTDIYSFGVTCYHMLAGQPPFRGQTAFELALQHVKNDPAPLSVARPDLPRPLCAIIHKMMAKDVSRRYASCTELLQDLAQFRDDGSGAIATTRPAFVNALRSALMSARALWIVTTLSIVAAILAGVALAWRASRPSWSPEGDVRREPIEPVLSEREKHEQFLKEAVAEYPDPGSPPDWLGIKFRRDLGLYYLENDRLVDAESYFDNLAASSAPPFRTLALLGKAIVLSRQDRADESNRIFLEVVRSRPKAGQPGDRLRVFFDKPQFPYEIARALARNKANASAAHPFPAELESLHEPPKPTGALKGSIRRNGNSKNKT